MLRDWLRAASDHMLKPTLTVPSQENSESPAGKADTPGSALDISDMSSDCRRCVTAWVSATEVWRAVPCLAGLPAACVAFCEAMPGTEVMWAGESAAAAAAAQTDCWQAMAQGLAGLARPAGTLQLMVTANPFG